MNTYEMLNTLGLRLEDASKKEFTEAFKLQCINNAQNTVAGKLHPKYLSELEYIKTGLTVTSGITAVLTSANITYNVLGGSDGILKVKDASTGLWMHRIDVEHSKNNEAYYLAGTTRNPMYYVFANKIYTLPTSITSINVYFRRVPTTLYGSFTLTNSGASTSSFSSTSTGISTTDDTYNGCLIYNSTQDVYYYVYDFTGETQTFAINTTQSGDKPVTNDTFYIINNPYDIKVVPGITCELNPVFHEIVVTVAEAECWIRDGNKNRYDSAMSYAKMQIDYYNAVARANEGIGTAKENR